MLSYAVTWGGGVRKNEMKNLDDFNVSFSTISHPPVGVELIKISLFLCVNYVQDLKDKAKNE